MEIRDQLQIIIKALEDKKAEDISILDIQKISVMADYFVIATGLSKNQIGAMMNELEQKLSQNKIHAKSIEGTNASGWVLLDYQDIVIHIFDRESRAFYDLERIWGDAVKLSPEDLRTKADSIS
ncbi:MAG: ribosome silencing factor [Lachnospiraceae bacterium]|nr:ribosome silencing factor [Lachnospiraceae bacterium]